MKRITNKVLLFTALFFFGVNMSCEELEVENPNQPTMVDVLSTPDDVRNVVQSAFLSYWQAVKTYNIGMTADVMADHTTVSWGNFAWREMSWEPRKAWNNDPGYNDAAMTEDIYYPLYAAISQVNDALIAVLVNEMDIGAGGADNDLVVASSYLIRGMSLGQLGLTFDQAMIPLHTSDLAALEFEPWSAVLEAAVADLKQAASLSTGKSFVWGASTVPGVTLNAAYIAQLANSYAARFLALGARTKAQNDNMSWTTLYDWSDVKDFADKGLTADFAPEGNGLPWDGGTWWDLNIKYLRQPGWGRADCRVVNLLDPAYPVRYPTNSEGLATSPPTVHAGVPAGAAISNDARFSIDFQFLPANDFRPERGGWHYSHYRHSRYDFPATTSSEGFGMGESRGPLRELRAYDNLLMKAEAHARTGDATGAAAILNDAANERKVRGNLPDVAADVDDVLSAIFYERDIELFHNGWMIGFCDMRRRDFLQQGTPLHFPVPGQELGVLNVETYTFGGYDNADGINSSNGGAWIKPFYHFSK